MRKRRFQRSNGFTLSEIVLATTVASILCLGIISGALTARRSAESTVYHNLAEAVTIGFLEQLKSIDYTVLRLFGANNWDVDFFIKDGSPITVGLNQATFTIVQVPLDADSAGNYTLFMDYEFRPVVIEHEPRLLTLMVVYRWRDPHTRTWRQREMAVGRASVPLQ